MTETTYALRWFRLRLTELDRVPWPDKSWLRGKPKVQKQKGLFDESDY